MKKHILNIALAYSVFASCAYADMAVNSNIGNCGWGSKLLQGNSGIAPQVLAVTINGTSGSQTFGISSGTSGCTQDGVVRSNWKTAMFIRENGEKLAKDISTGSGDSLDTLSSLMGMNPAEKAEFIVVARANFSEIFTTAGMDSGVMISNLKSTLESNANLTKFSALL